MQGLQGAARSGPGAGAKSGNPFEVSRLTRVSGGRIPRVLDIDLPRRVGRRPAVYLHHRRLDRDAGEVHDNYTGTDHQGELLEGLQGDLLGVELRPLFDQGRVIGLEVQHGVRPDAQVQLLIDFLVQAPVDVYIVAAADKHGVIPASIAADHRVAIAPVGLIERAQGADVQALLRAEEDLLAVLLVFEAQHVEGVIGAVRGAASAESALRLILGQRERRLVDGVIDRADDHRAIRIAFQELDHHLVANAGYPLVAPGFAGPGLKHAGPAALLAHAIPGKPELHLGHGAGPDFVQGLALGWRQIHHLGRLRALDHRLGRAPRRAKQRLCGNACEGVFIRRLGVLAGRVARGL